MRKIFIAGIAIAAAGLIAIGIVVTARGHQQFSQDTTAAASRASAAASPVRLGSSGGPASSGAPSPLPNDPLERAIAVLGLQRDKLQQLGSFADEAGRSHLIYLAPAQNGQSCLFQVTERGTAGPATPLGIQGGGCRPAGARHDALRWSAQFEGSPERNTGFFIFGVATSDVGAVDVVDAGGGKHRASLNAQGAFFYEAPEGVPFQATSVVAYDALGAKRQEMHIGG